MIFILNITPSSKESHYEDTVLGVKKNTLVPYIQINKIIQ